MDKISVSNTWAGIKRKRDGHENTAIDLAPCKKQRNDDHESAIDLFPCKQIDCPLDFVDCPEPAKCAETRCNTIGCTVDDQLSCHSDLELTPKWNWSTNFENANTGMFAMNETYGAYNASSSWMGFQTPLMLDSLDLNMTAMSAQSLAQQVDQFNFDGHMQPQQPASAPYEDCFAGNITSDAEQGITDAEQPGEQPMSDIEQGIANAATSQTPADIGHFVPNDATTQSTASSRTSEENIFECRWLIDKEDLVCGKIFGDAKELHQHFRACHRTHGKEDKNDHRCYWEGCWVKDRIGRQRESSGTSSKLDRHVLSHTEWHEHVCEYCSKTTATADQLKKHVRTHTGEQPHICTWRGPNVKKGEEFCKEIDGMFGAQCTKAFKTGSELETHLDVHRGAQKHVCEYCHKRFTDASNLSKHKKTHQVAQYHCTVECGLSFRRMDHWRRHQDEYDHMPELYRPKNVYQTVEEKEKCGTEMEKWKKAVHGHWKLQGKGDKLLPKSEWHSNKGKAVEEFGEDAYFADGEW